MFDLLLDRFDRHKYGIIGTLVLHTAVLFTLAISRMNHGPGPEQGNEMRVDVLDAVQAEALLQAIETGTPLPSAPVTNTVSDLNAQVRAAQAMPTVSARTAERMENDLRDLERSEFDRLAEERRAAGKEVVVPELDPSKWDKQQYLPKQEAPARVDGPATVSYDLKGRRPEVLEVPAYLCTGSGRVVVRIAVDRSGIVRQRSLDKQATTVSEDCMLEYALAYAAEARFDHAANAPEEQIGTITFLFLPQ
ncbi:MAG: hypothetical protein IT228_04005 [Flavobacteriales bacterium]|nr:hypothetical protein [Flavobacteriales bacterium]MCC6576486.1 hypothetical protein [Flavobacteriales bacterium]NUQ16518.1 hypothetical protein [Flavobacteriales bacterium]